MKEAPNRNLLLCRVFGKQNRSDPEYLHRFSWSRGEPELPAFRSDEDSHKLSSGEEDRRCFNKGFDLKCGIWGSSAQAAPRIQVV